MAVAMIDHNESIYLVRAIVRTREYEIGCDECLDQVDHFVEMELSGLNAAEAMPLVRDHLDKCVDCREEFEALLEALHSMSIETGPNL